MSAPASPDPKRPVKKPRLQGSSLIILPTESPTGQQARPGARPIANAPSNLDPNIPASFKANIAILLRLEDRYKRLLDRRLTTEDSAATTEGISDLLPVHHELVSIPTADAKRFRYNPEPALRNPERFSRAVAENDQNSSENPRCCDTGLVHDESNGTLAFQFKYADEKSRVSEILFTNQAKSENDQMYRWQIRVPDHAMAVYPTLDKRMRELVDKQHLTIRHTYKYAYRRAFLHFHRITDLSPNDPDLPLPRESTLHLTAPNEYRFQLYTEDLGIVALTVKVKIPGFPRATPPEYRPSGLWRVNPPPYHQDLKSKADAAEATLKQAEDNDIRLSDEIIDTCRSDIGLYQSSLNIIEWFTYALETLEPYRDDWIAWRDRYRVLAVEHTVLPKRFRTTWQDQQFIRFWTNTNYQDEDGRLTHRRQVHVNLNYGRNPGEGRLYTKELSWTAIVAPAGINAEQEEWVKRAAAENWMNSRNGYAVLLYVVEMLGNMEREDGTTDVGDLRAYTEEMRQTKGFCDHILKNCWHISPCCDNWVTCEEIDFQNETCAICLTKAASDNRLQRCDRPKKGKGRYVFDRMMACLKRDISVSAKNPKAVAIPTCQELFTAVSSFQVESKEKGEDYQCPITGFISSTASDNKLLFPSNDAAHLVDSLSPDSEQLILHHPSNIQVIPRCLNYAKGTSSTATTERMLEAMLVQEEFGKKLSRLPKLDGSIEDTDETKPVKAWFQQTREEIRDNSAEEKQVAHRVRDRVNGKTPLAIIRSVNAFLFKRTKEAVTAPLIKRHRKRFLAAKGIPPTKASKQRATGSAIQESARTSVPVANTVCIPEIDDVILGFYEAKYGRKLKLTPDGVRNPFTADPYLTGKNLQTIFKARRATLMRWCNRKFETMASVTARALYISACIAAIKSDGVELRSGHEFTNEYRTSYRMSIGREVVGTNMMTECICGNPRDLDDIDEEQKTTIEENWFINSWHSDASPTHTEDSLQKVLAAFRQRNLHPTFSA